MEVGSEKMPEKEINKELAVSLKGIEKKEEIVQIITEFLKQSKEKKEDKETKKEDIKWFYYSPL